MQSTFVKLVIRGYEISKRDGAGLHWGGCLSKVTFTLGEYDYTYIEEQEGEAIVPKTRKRTARKDIVKFESKLIDYPGRQRQRAHVNSHCIICANSLCACVRVCVLCGVCGVCVCDLIDMSKQLALVFCNKNRSIKIMIVFCVNLNSAGCK